MGAVRGKRLVANGVNGERPPVLVESGCPGKRGGHFKGFGAYVVQTAPCSMNLRRTYLNLLRFHLADAGVQVLASFCRVSNVLKWRGSGILFNI